MSYSYDAASEAENNRMVAAQDFIISIRRLHRINAPRTVINVIRNIADYSNSQKEQSPAERELFKIAERVSGSAHVMGNGDVLLVLPRVEGGALRVLSDNINALVGSGNRDDLEKNILAFQLPGEYTKLRERANFYAELARADVAGPVQQAELALQAEDVRGPLTAYSLSQVEKLLENIDIKRYVRTQPVYTQGASGAWEKAFIDFFISLADLKRERFPRLNLATPERLFLELCYTLDRKLLLELSSQIDLWKDKKISLNLSAETVLSAAFAQFCHVLPKAIRGQVAFEIHRSDIFLNFSTFRNAIEVLKLEGFKVGLDGITPSTLPYINFALFNVDYFKINVTRDKWAELKDGAAMKALEAMPRDKIVFSQCDHDESLHAGQKMGVRFYQGWLIDDLAHNLST